VTTLVYAVRDGKVLMMRRRKEPNFGQWTAPGGKVELDESPAECAVRELREETGLATVGRPELRLIVTETSPLPDWQWLMFVYRVCDFTGELVECDEGELAWIDQELVPTLDIPQADAVFYGRVVGEAAGPFAMKFEYDADLRLLDWREE
jgi:8-oxo-dGTP diphosphatase